MERARPAASRLIGMGRRQASGAGKGGPEHVLNTHAMALLETLPGSEVGDESALRRYFRDHGQLGARDRTRIGDLVLGCLRHLRHLDFALQRLGIGSPGAWQRLLAWRVLYGDAAGSPSAAGLGPEELELAWRLTALAPVSPPAAVRAELPDWLFDPLAARLGEAETVRLGEALGRTAPLDLRVNRLRVKRERAAAALAAEGFETRPTRYSPVGLRAASGSRIITSRAFRDGWIEVQDEGSQLLSPLLEPRRNELVVDLCAGTGGKTLHLGALMGNRGHLYAFDLSSARLDRMRPRLRRAGLETVRAARIETPSAAPVRALWGKADRVLVDAPCSGTGTLRRRPELRWQHHDMARLQSAQERLLEAAAALLRPGGRLVYATCSLADEENESRLEAFLAAHRAFARRPAGEILARRGIPLRMEDDDLRLYPHRQGCDAFFAAVLEKRR